MEFKKINKNCEWCDKPLRLNNSRDIKRKRFCNRVCMGKFFGKEKLKKSKCYIYRKCQICNNHFGFWKSQNKKYCSRECFANKKLNYYLEKPNGYIIKYDRGKARRVFKHVEIVEKVLDRRLKTNECVHHINMIKTDNSKSNLLICDRSYHRWLHGRYALRFAELILYRRGD